MGYNLESEHLDTPREITDTQGNVVWQWDNIDPFGNNAANENPNGAGQFSFPLRFPGQYADKETNTNYNVNRDYDPAIGRYIESDPIGLEGGINTYTYVDGKPLSFVDPLGLYHCAPGVNCNFSPAMDSSLVCFDECSGLDNVITSGYRKGGGPHGHGDGADMNRKDNPCLTLDKAKQCRKKCFPVGYGQDEQNGPNSSDPKGTHFHLQENAKKGTKPGWGDGIRPYQPSPIK